MAAKKSASKNSSKDATKTPSDASKLSKLEQRRPAPTIGDTAGAEFNPARTEEGERVAQTGANPAASRAGLKTSFGVLEADDNRPSVEVGTVDGGSVVLTVDGKDVPLSRDDLSALSKHLDAARQS